MKKLYNLMFLFALMPGFLLLTYCTKEGPAGDPGQDGEDGEPGTAGCVECHDSNQDILAASMQWEASGHALGGNFERNGESCAPCHTSQGFLEIVETGTMETAAPISNPLPPNCYTCHKVHETYTLDDWQLTHPEPVDFWIDGVVADMGSGNQCGTCHQSRIPDPMFDVSTPNEMIDITYFRWGPHHGPQSNMFAGSGGYEIGSGYTNSAHADLIEDGCVTCHMAEPYGTQSGGHQMSLTHTYHGQPTLNNAGCLECHTNEDNLEALVESTKEDVNNLMADLRDVLLQQGVLDSTDYIVPMEMTMNQAGAVFNYKFVLEDRSDGAHNAPYAKKLLENSIAALTE